MCHSICREIKEKFCGGMTDALICGTCETRVKVNSMNSGATSLALPSIFAIYQSCSLGQIVGLFCDSVFSFVNCA